MESYYLQRARQHWILWLRQYDDNNGQWEEPAAKARCPRKGLADKDAAMILLGAILAEDLRRYDPDLERFHSITGTGLLSIKEIDTVADTVWGN
jgi:hypothetical protein